MSKEKDFVCFLLLEERLPRTTAQKCAVYEGKPCCQRQKDGRKIHSGRGGMIILPEKKQWNQALKKQCLIPLLTGFGKS